MNPSPIALVYGSVSGIGGLGGQVATAAAGLARLGLTVCLGPGATESWPLCPMPEALVWERNPPPPNSWFARTVVRRVWPGRLVLARDQLLGKWASSRMPLVRPKAVYTFTQVGLESLRWAKREGVPTVLDNPNTHIRQFAQAYREESKKWCGRIHLGHPTEEMIERVEEEYRLADRIRVSSARSKASMVEYGVPADKVTVIEQPINLTRFRPPAVSVRSEGPLRVCYVGSLDLRKGFPYLLRACRIPPPPGISLTVVGATGDRCSKRLFARESAGLSVVVDTGDPVPTYQRSEILVLPSLEDGFGFVVAEAMACGLPVVVTDQCGSAEWVRSKETGWVIPGGDSEAIAEALNCACAQRNDLVNMGIEARKDAVRLGSDMLIERLGSWVAGGLN